MCWPCFYVHQIRKEKNVWFTTVPITSTSTVPYIQGYPQRMRLQSRLYEIYILSVSYKYDILKYGLLSFIAKSLNKPIKNHIRGRIFIFNLKSLYLKSFSLILSWWTRIKVLAVFLPVSPFHQEMDLDWSKIHWDFLNRIEIKNWDILNRIEISWKELRFPKKNWDFLNRNQIS